MKPNFWWERMRTKIQALTYLPQRQKQQRAIHPHPAEKQDWSAVRNQREMLCQSLSLAMHPLCLCRAWGVAGCRALQQVLSSKISAHTLNAGEGEADMYVLIATLDKQTPRGLFLWLLCSSQCVLCRASVSCAIKTVYYKILSLLSLPPCEDYHGFSPCGAGAEIRAQKKQEPGKGSGPLLCAANCEQSGVMPCFLRDSPQLMSL